VSVVTFALHNPTSLIFVKCDVISYYTNYTNYTNMHMDTNLTFVDDDMEWREGCHKQSS
jgi:arginine deiminase